MRVEAANMGAVIENRWREGPADRRDELDELVYLSNLIGREESLVQPGGGNTSVKLCATDPSGRDEELLLVKGSGTDLRTIRRGGFTHLSMARLSGLRERGEMNDEEMMAFMRTCMSHPHRDAVPSVETPLHSILPYRVIAHTHDVATMSLTNLRDDLAEKLVHELFEGEIVYVPYARPGFPLARLVLERASEIPSRAGGLTLAHHGLVVWGDDARQCYERLLRVVAKVNEYVAADRRQRSALGEVVVPTPRRAAREERAELLLPVIRGELGVEERVVLHWDDSPAVLTRLSRERFRELSQRGMATPEHILRAGRLPIWLSPGWDRSRQEAVRSAREQLRRARSAYGAYHERCARPGETPLVDWAKVVLVPGLGLVTAFKDKKSARTANTCYRAVMESIENAEALDEFRFLSESEVYEFEHWPLERRKVDEGAAREHKEFLLPRRVVAIVGAASGIGAAAARRFLEEGAHVVMADLDDGRAGSLAGELAEGHPERVIAAPVDVRDESSLAALLRQTVLEFGGIDALFYTAGLAPSFAPIAEIDREDLQQQLEVHYLGAVLAMRETARVMERQGTGGSIVCSVSKAAVSPGKEAVAYGGSKAALQHALRVAAVELGEHGIRVNAINADQIDTPLFMRFVEERAARKGISVEEQLESYRQRNAMGVGLIPPEAVAEIAALLASERFRFTTGDIVTIDGGLPDAFPR